jgi:hypothetical protein
MTVIFCFLFKMVKNPMLKVELNKTFLNASICIRCLILQNGFTRKWNTYLFLISN